MSDELEILKKRFIELGRKTERGYFTFSDFLGLAEQNAFNLVKRDIICKYTVFGGADGTERIMIRFGDPEELGYEMPFPIRCIKIEPKAIKFAEKLGHRDYLGAILNLGIERSSVGDIIIRGAIAYLFSKEEISDFIVNELETVRHTSVKASYIDEVPEGELYRTERKNVQVASARIDALVARVFNSSREDAQSLFKKRLVYLNGEECESGSKALKEGDTVSVRGHGRFVYHGYLSLTKKGRLNAEVEIYI